MLYLSRLIIDTSRPQVRRDLADCHQLHQRILSAFPTAPNNTSARGYFGLLYRVEPVDRYPQLVRVLVQSTASPNWSHLPERYLGPAPDQRGNPAVRSVMDEYEQIRAGMQLLFRLRANPTKRVSTKNTQQPKLWHGKRIELSREEDQLAWLARKSEQCGFRLIGVTIRPELPDIRVTTLEKTHGWQRRAENPPMRLSFGAVLFEGQLEVTDRNKFIATLQSGIGSGKAFGFGLLSIATVR